MTAYFQELWSFVVKVAQSFISSEKQLSLKQGNCIWPILKDFFKGFGGNKLYLCRTPQGLEAFWQKRLGKSVSQLYSLNFLLFASLLSWNFHFTIRVAGYIWQQLSHQSSFTTEHRKKWVSWRWIICMITLNATAAWNHRSVQTDHTLVNLK